MKDKEQQRLRRALVFMRRYHKKEVIELLKRLCSTTESNARALLNQFNTRALDLLEKARKARRDTAI